MQSSVAPLLTLVRKLGDTAFVEWDDAVLQGFGFNNDYDIQVWSSVGFSTEHEQAVKTEVFFGCKAGQLELCLRVGNDTSCGTVYSLPLKVRTSGAHFQNFSTLLMDIAKDLGLDWTRRDVCQVKFDTDNAWMMDTTHQARRPVTTEVWYKLTEDLQFRLHVYFGMKDHHTYVLDLEAPNPLQ